MHDKQSALSCLCSKDAIVNAEHCGRGTWSRFLRSGSSGIWTRYPSDDRWRTYQWATTPHKVAKLVILSCSVSNWFIIDHCKQFTIERNIVKNGQRRGNDECWWTRWSMDGVKRRRKKHRIKRNVTTRLLTCSRAKKVKNECAYILWEREWTLTINA